MNRRQLKRYACHTAALVLVNCEPEWTFLRLDGEPLDDKEAQRRSEAWEEVVQGLHKKGTRYKNEPDVPLP